MKVRIRWSMLLFVCVLVIGLAACGTDSPGDPSPVDGQDGDASLTDTDTSVPDTDTDGDASPDIELDGETDGEIIEGSARRIIYRLCETDADCPTGGTSCIGLTGSPISWSHKGANGGEPQSLSATATDLFGAEIVPAGSGVCSADCTGASDCSEIDSIGAPATPWSCQLVAKGAEPYAGIGTPVDNDAMEAGQPFAAICRPPSIATVDNAFRFLCTVCATGGCNGVCIDPVSGEQLSGGGSICSNRCNDDDECVVGFFCSGAGNCTPSAGTCTACSNPDASREAELGAGSYGLGKCGSNEGKTPFDCDQGDGDTYFAISGGRIRPPSGAVGPNGALYCSAAEDSNCNGVADIEEMVGPAAAYAGIFKEDHCTACDDVCDDSVITGGVGGAANAAAECKCPEGNPDCSPSEAACVIGCAEGFLDCDGPNDCETDESLAETCGACSNDCNVVGDDTSKNVRTVSCDELIEEGTSTYSCGLVCRAGFADCNDDFSDGCEVELAVGVDQGDGTVKHCGSCTLASTSGFDPTFCGDLRNDDVEHVETFMCDSGTCAVEECEAFWGDCDGGTESGYQNGCEADLKRETNCGGCGIECDEFPRVFDADCVPQGNSAAVCEVTTCDVGFADCDEAVANGCEVTEADGFAQIDSCGGCTNDCRPLLNEFDDATAVAICTWDSSDDETNTLDFCEVRCDPTAVTSCGGCGNDCTDLQTAGANLGSVSCSFVEGDDVYKNNDDDLTFCDIECEQGFASCPAADSDPRTCETDVTTLEDCGGCGQVCATTGDVEKVDCVDNGASPATCECVDAASEQVCNGKQTICSEEVDEGCPSSLMFSSVVDVDSSIAADLSMSIYQSDNGNLTFNPDRIASTLPGGVESNNPLVNLAPVFVKDNGGEWNLGGFELDFQPYDLEPVLENDGSAFESYRIVLGGPSEARTLRSNNFKPGDITGSLNGEYDVVPSISCEDNSDGRPISVNEGEQVLMPVGLIVEYFKDDRFGNTPDRVSGIGLECRYFTVTATGDGNPGDYEFASTGPARNTEIVSKLSGSVANSEVYTRRVTLSVGNPARYQPITRLEIEQPFSVSGIYTNTNGTKADITYALGGVPPRFATSDSRVGQPETDAFLWFGLVSGINIKAFVPIIEP